MKLVFPSLLYKEKAIQFIEEFYSDTFKVEAQKYMIDLSKQEKKSWQHG